MRYYFIIRERGYSWVDKEAHKISDCFVSKLPHYAYKTYDQQEVPVRCALLSLDRNIKLSKKNIIFKCKENCK